MYNEYQTKYRYFDKKNHALEKSGEEKKLKRSPDKSGIHRDDKKRQKALKK